MANFVLHYYSFSTPLKKHEGGGGGRRFSFYTKGEKMREKVDEIKMENIIDMAVLYSGMSRVFEKGSMNKIRKEIGKRLNEFFNLKSKEEYNKKHEEFCNWFIKNIKVAERRNEKERVNQHMHRGGRLPKS